MEAIAHKRKRLLGETIAGLHGKLRGDQDVLVSDAIITITILSSIFPDAPVRRDVGI